MKYLIAFSFGIMLAVTGPASADSLERDEMALEDHAMDLAINNLPSGDQGLTIGMGAGAFGGENALAVGASFGEGPFSFTLNAVTTDDMDVGVGVGISWKFGK